MANLTAYPIATPKSDDLLLGTVTPKVNTEEVEITSNFTVQSVANLIGALVPGGGTVTNVSALVIGSAGSDLTSTVSNSSSTPVITLNVPNASGTTRGVLTSTDWSTFNSKGIGIVTSLTTTGTTGAATLSSGVLNVPNYASNSGTVTSVVGGDGLTASTVGSVVTLNSTASFTKTNGTYIDLTSTFTALNGAITLTADLSASGTPTGAKFLRDDNTWSIPSGTGTMASFTLGADSVIGTNTVSNAETATFSGGTGITTALNARTTTFTMDNTAVAPASYTYTSLTVDQQGRITAASNGAAPATVNDSTITLSGGTGLADLGGVITLNQSGAETITFNVGAGTGILANTNDVAINYSGASNAVLASTAATIVGADTIWFSDASDDIIKKGLVSDLPFSGNLTGMVTSVGNATTVVTNANLTGVITSVGNATSIASQTGTGTKFVVDTSPILITPNIGVATGTSLDLNGFATADGYKVPGGNSAEFLTSDGGVNTEVAATNTINAFTRQQHFPLQTITVPGGTTNISWDLDTQQKAFITNSRDMTFNNPTNMRSGGKYTLYVQHVTTGYTVTFPTTSQWKYRFPISPGTTLSSGSNQLDIMYFESDGVYMYCTHVARGFGGTGLPPADSTPPVNPTIFTAGQAEDDIRMAWNNGTDNIAVASYSIRRNVGAGAYTTVADFSALPYPATAFVDQDSVSNFVVGTTYNYQIMTKDTTGNTSAWGDVDAPVPYEQF